MRVRPAVVLLALSLGFAIAAAGCSIKADKNGSTSSGTSESGSDASASKSKPSQAAKTDEKKTAPAASEAAASNHVRLVDKVCVGFEPHWTTISVGQSLTWTSELKTSVTIHVAAGAFEKADFVVRPGATVRTGPAKKAGDYSMWSEPTACQEAPRGTRGSGPGVTVRD